MIRVLLGFALPTLAVGLALLAPRPAAPPEGAAMQVAGSVAELQEAASAEAACASPLLLGGAGAGTGASLPLRILALVPLAGPDGVTFELRDLAAGGAPEDAALVLVYTPSGELVEAIDPEMLAAAPAGGLCAPEDTTQGYGAI